MKSRILFVTTLVLFFGILAATYFLFDLSSRNYELTDNLEQLNQQLNEATDQLDASEIKVTSLTDEVSLLSAEADDLTSSIEDIQSAYDVQKAESDELQSTYDELYSFTYCRDELLDLEMTYRSNAKASEALTQWVDEMWGDVIDSYWRDFWSANEPGLHVVETGYANDYFIVYFEQQDFFDAPNGVFIVSHHCWLDVESEN